MFEFCLVQSFQDFGIIIVNDRSPDAPMSIVVKYAEKVMWINFLWQ